jgi:hypothetical protein
VLKIVSYTASLTVALLLVAAPGFAKDNAASAQNLSGRHLIADRDKSAICGSFLRSLVPARGDGLRPLFNDPAYPASRAVVQPASSHDLYTSKRGPYREILAGPDCLGRKAVCLANPGLFDRAFLRSYAIGTQQLLIVEKCCFSGSGFQNAWLIPANRVPDTSETIYDDDPFTQERMKAIGAADLSSRIRWGDFPFVEQFSKFDVLDLGGRRQLAITAHADANPNAASSPVLIMDLPQLLGPQCRIRAFKLR